MDDGHSCEESRQAERIIFSYLWYDFCLQVVGIPRTHYVNYMKWRREFLMNHNSL